MKESAIDIDNKGGVTKLNSYVDQMRKCDVKSKVTYNFIYDLLVKRRDGVDILNDTDKIICLTKRLEYHPIYPKPCKLVSKPLYKAYVFSLRDQLAMYTIYEATK